jgi:diguanylate cyclase (GGDEF)-like protein
MVRHETPGALPRAWAPLRSLLRSPFESLPARIIASVYAAALVTSVLVAGIATKSTEAFLRGGIEERFPALLAQTLERLDTWYSQRQIDIGTFAASETVIESLRDAPDAAEAAAREARMYLAYVQESFPQYRSLFVLDPAGRERVSSGATPALSEAERERLARLSEPRVGPVRWVGGARRQVISAPVTHEGRSIGTFHALPVMDSLDALLRSDDFEETTRVYVVGADHRVLARSPGAPERSTYERALPAFGSALEVDDYSEASGEHLVGAAVLFPRFDWVLVVEESYDAAFKPVVSTYRRILAINVAIVVVFGIVAFAIARSIVQPIRALSLDARRIAQGETDVEIPATRSRDEIGVLTRALDEMVRRLQRNQVELERKQAQIERANQELRRTNDELVNSNEMLEQLSLTDGLTRLHNHRFFQDRLALEIRRSDRNGEPLALILMDIDDFKLLNDRYGHAVGDEVLRRVGHVINNTVRGIDLPARYGGEEFAVLAPATPRKGALALAEKLRMAVRSSRFRGEGIDADRALSVTVSIGVAIYAGDPKAFFNDADRALYRAKAAGKDCVMLADV